MKRQKQYLVAIVEAMLELKPAATDYGKAPEIQVRIGTLDAKDGKPRNFSLDSGTEDTFAGECFARLYASSLGNVFSWYGPTIYYGNLQDYEYAAKSIKRITKAYQAMSEVRGASRSEAEQCGRWLEACEIERVFVRAAGDENRGWLHEGDWEEMTVGRFVTALEHKLWQKPAEVAA